MESESIDLVTVLIAGYGGYVPLVGVVKVLWNALQSERKDHKKTIRLNRNIHESSASDVENRLAELEEARDD